MSRVRLWYPEHPRPSCHAVIPDATGRRLVLIQRGGEPYRGWWGLPGGAVELGETVEEALRREVREETGLEIAVDRLLTLKDAIGRDEERRITYHFVILFFTARLLGGRLRAGDDAAGARWVAVADLDAYPLVPGAAEVIRLAGLGGPAAGNRGAPGAEPAGEAPAQAE